MKKLTYLLICLSYILFAGGCSDDKEENSLKGTKWELEGYVTAESSNMKTMVPKKIIAIDRYCYALSFDDSNISVWGVVNSLSGKYTISKNDIITKDLIQTEIHFTCYSDEDSYFDLIKKN
jgi:hypothetical protein